MDVSGLYNGPPACSPRTLLRMDSEPEACCACHLGPVMRRMSRFFKSRRVSQTTWM